jgi:hypothetical protein
MHGSMATARPFPAMLVGGCRGTARRVTPEWGNLDWRCCGGLGLTIMVIHGCGPWWRGNDSEVVRHMVVGDIRVVEEVHDAGWTSWRWQWGWRLAEGRCPCGGARGRRGTGDGRSVRWSLRPVDGLGTRGTPRRSSWGRRWVGTVAGRGCRWGGIHNGELIFI